MLSHSSPRSDAGFSHCALKISASQGMYGPEMQTEQSDLSCAEFNVDKAKLWVKARVDSSKTNQSQQTNPVREKTFIYRENYTVALVVLYFSLLR